MKKHNLTTKEKWMNEKEYNARAGCNAVAPVQQTSGSEMMEFLRATCTRTDNLVERLAGKLHYVLKLENPSLGKDPEKSTALPGYFQDMSDCLRETGRVLDRLESIIERVDI
jgi:hypothetical protein